MFVALAETHAAAASVAQLFQAGTLPVDTARWGVIGMLAASVVAKSVVAFSTGGPRYGLRVTDQVSIAHAPNPHNADYLRTKAQRMGHMLHHQGLPLDEEMVHAERTGDDVRDGG